MAAMTGRSALSPREEFSYLPAYVAPRTETERRLAQIWQHALAVDRVGATDSYEDLGGSSLLAAAIFVEIEKVFGVKIEMIMLVAAPTIEELSVKIEEFVGDAKG
jgi:acyl carrier protein